MLNGTNLITLNSDLALVSTQVKTAIHSWAKSKGIIWHKTIICPLVME